MIGAARSVIERRIAERPEGDRHPYAPLVLGPRRGIRFDPNNWRRDAGWKAALDALGLGRAKLHDLRHTHASLVPRSAADIYVLQKVLGHRESATTIDRYGHLYDNEIDELGASLEAAQAARMARVWPQNSSSSPLKVECVMWERENPWSVNQGLARLLVPATGFEPTTFCSGGKFLPVGTNPKPLTRAFSTGKTPFFKTSPISVPEESGSAMHVLIDGVKVPLSRGQRPMPQDVPDGVYRLPG